MVKLFSFIGGDEGEVFSAKVVKECPAAVSAESRPNRLKFNFKKRLIKKGGLP
jgi:hypothetical protein